MIIFYLTKIGDSGDERGRVSMNWSQPHEAIRREINTAAGTVTARKVLVSGRAEGQEQKALLSHEVTAATIY